MTVGTQPFQIKFIAFSSYYMTRSHKRTTQAEALVK